MKIYILVETFYKIKLEVKNQNKRKTDLSHESLADAFVENKGRAFVNTLLFHRLYFKICSFLNKVTIIFVESFSDKDRSYFYISDFV